jgi:hypothetical protein
VLWCWEISFIFQIEALFLRHRSERPAVDTPKCRWLTNAANGCNSERRAKPRGDLHGNRNSTCGRSSGPILAIHAAVSIIALAVAVAAVVEVFKSGLRTTFFEQIFTTWWKERSKSARDALRSWAEPGNIDKNWARVIPNKEVQQQFGSAAESAEFASQEAEWFKSGFEEDDTAQQSTVRREGLEACKLPRDLFMKKIENIGRTVVEQSSIRTSDFIALTDGAPCSDQHLVMSADRVDRVAPHLRSYIQTTTRDVSELHPVIIAAQNHVATALERNLDDLQLRLMRLWPLSIRGFSVFMGLVIAFLGGWWIAGRPISDFGFQSQSSESGLASSRALL